MLQVSCPLRPGLRRRCAPLAPREPGAPGTVLREARTRSAVPGAQASATHSISMSNSSGHEPTVTKVRVGGSAGKCRR